MSLRSARRQKTEQQAELPLRDRGEAPKEQRSGEAQVATNGNESSDQHLMEKVVTRSNLKAALKRVKANKGSPGMDGMTVDELPEYLVEHWIEIREQLLAGKYQPKPVKRVEIPKASGGVRQLGIPCAMDRFLQQAILQVLQPIFDPKFSESSFGFRPGRGAHDAICAAQKYIQEGRRWVVDVDLEKFFDRVNHDVLMGRLEKRIKDKRMLGLIRRYLEAGVMADGIVTERYEGTPQGGPLSPLLANVLLDEVDKELEKRGHKFARYADDNNVYVYSKRAAEDVMNMLRKLYAGLKLKVNEAKSTVARPWERKFLGYSFWVGPGKEIKRRVAPKALETMKEKVREITGRNRGISIELMAKDLREYIIGWKAYFRLADTQKIFRGLDSWIRRRLRMVQLKQWKRGKTVYRELKARGIKGQALLTTAACTKCWWRTSASQALNIALPEAYFDAIGVPKLAT